MYVIPNSATHCAVVRISFAEGDDEVSPVAFGDFDECDRAARDVPAISYSGARQAQSACAEVRELKPFCRHCGQRHEEKCEVSP